MIYDLTHTLQNDIPYFPGDPEPHITTDVGMTPWCVSSIQIGSHSGTHIDAPLHLIQGGRGVGSYQLECFIRPGIVLDASQYGDDQPIGVDILAGVELKPGMCVLIRTGWSAYWYEQRYFVHPFLSDELASVLVAAGVGLVGVDMLNIDSTPAAASTVHATLLGADLLVAENLCGLDQLTAGLIYIVAMLPLAVGNLDGAPIRALAWDVDHRFDRDDSAS